MRVTIELDWTHAETIAYLLNIMKSSLEQTLKMERQDIETAHQFLTGKDKTFDEDFTQIQEATFAACKAMIFILETQMGIKMPGD